MVTRLEGTNHYARYHLKSLSGIETRLQRPPRQLLQLDITLNPYQGLKRIHLCLKSQATPLDITLNPYQGLKLVDRSHDLIIFEPRYHLKSLSGIETWQTLLQYLPAYQNSISP